VSESKWVLREVLFDDGQPIAHREPHDWSMLEAAKESLREHMTEIHRLRRVNAELLAALKDMHSGWKYIRETYGPLYGVGWDRAQKQAEAAIAKAEDKP
jgi:hypothetical protein